MELHEYLKHLRTKKGISSRKLSERINKGSSYISAVENGRNAKLDYYNVSVILKELGLNHEEIKEVCERYNIDIPEAVEEEIKFERKINDNYETGNLFDFVDKRSEYLVMMDEVHNVLHHLAVADFKDKDEVLTNFYELIIGMGKNPEKFNEFISMFKTKI